MIIYSIFYFINILIHYDGGIVSTQYDFYNFLHGSLISCVYVAPIMLVVTYAISYVILYLNNKLK